MTSVLSFPNHSVYCAAHVHFHVCVCVSVCVHVCISCGRTGGLKTCLLHLEVTASIGATSKFDKEITAHHSLLWVKLCSPKIHTLKYLRMWYHLEMRFLGLPQYNITGVLMKEEMWRQHSHRDDDKRGWSQRWVLLLQATEHQQSPGNHQKLGKKHATNSLSVSEGTIPVDNLILDF